MAKFSFDSEGLVVDWIKINRSKRGPANHKAFLSVEGKKLVKEREKDFTNQRNKTNLY